MAGVPWPNPPAGGPGGQTYSTARLSVINLAHAARGGGFRDDTASNDPGQRHSELAVAIAIALAESGGRPAALGRGVGYYYLGLWQIQRRTKDPSLFDALTNARAAYALYTTNPAGSRRFTGRWSTFDSRAYVPFLPVAERAVSVTYTGGFAQQAGHAVESIPGVAGLVHGTEDVGAAAASAIGDLNPLEAVKQLITWVELGFIRVGEALGGAALIGLGIYLVFAHTRAGKQVTSDVKHAAPAAVFA